MDTGLSMASGEECWPSAKMENSETIVQNQTEIFCVNWRDQF